ncbi:glycosyltransferase family 9 protein [Burkholderia mayonis]|uniref:glycosyltransferase family 9 protein n=1 Tax=Burkholderia mayonis TaxID=1385591 RepID=UPI0009E92032|nr:glycosyltransferase family 9 protein [Burkholderia mayonis]
MTTMTTSTSAVVASLPITPEGKYGNETIDSMISLDLSGIAYENHHAPVFHAWLKLNQQERRQALHDRYVFLSVACCIDQHLTDLLRLDFQKANEFTRDVLNDISYLSQGFISHSEEWFRGLNQLAGTFTDHNYLPEASAVVDIASRTGVVKFPRIAQSISLHRAYLDAVAGRREQASEVALRLVRRPFLLPNRRELPKLYQKLMYILASSNHLDEYKTVLWKGICSFHSNEQLRIGFTSQIVKTYRGALRAFLRNEVPLRYRLPFLLANVARLAGSSPVVRSLRAHKLLWWVYLGTLYLLHSSKSSATFQPTSVQHKTDHASRRWRIPLPASMQKRRILITRAMGGIGDVLMMTAGLRALAKKYPKAQIDFAVPKSFHPIFEGLNEIRIVDVNSDDVSLAQYNRWINLTDCPAGRVEARQYPNVRSNRIEVFARAMGASKSYVRRSVGFLPFYRVTAEERKWATSYLNKINPDGLPVVGIQPFSVDSYKNWVDMENLAKHLSRDHCVLIFHHEAISGYASSNIHKILTPLRKSVALLAECQRLVAVDSAFVHLSAALGVKTVAIFGPTSGHVFCRYYPRVKYVTPKKSDFPCAPCWRNEHKPCHLTKGRESICLHSITTERVLTALETDFGQPNPRTNILTRIRNWALYGRE